ncbi:MAG: hypothetical protein VX675_04130, partial [Planctomycetota bacterium]|nr:hypothetical protein [Planctomycetota bacterium]
YFLIRGLVMSASAYIKSIFADKSEITFSRRKHPSLKEFPNQQENFFGGLPSSYCTPGDDKALRKKGFGQAVLFQP